MSKLVYGTCETCGRQQVPGSKVAAYRGDGDPRPTGSFYSANMHRLPKGAPRGEHNLPWCFNGTLKEVEARGSVSRPLPASEANLKKLSDDQLQTLLERVEVEMLRREP